MDSVSSVGAFGALAEINVFVFGSITITLWVLMILSDPGNIDGSSGLREKCTYHYKNYYKIAEEGSQLRRLGAIKARLIEAKYVIMKVKFEVTVAYPFGRQSLFRICFRQIFFSTFYVFTNTFI